MYVHAYIYIYSICYHHTTEFLTTFRTPASSGLIPDIRFFFMCIQTFGYMWYKILEVCHPWHDMLMFVSHGVLLFLLIRLLILVPLMEYISALPESIPMTRSASHCIRGVVSKE